VLLWGVHAHPALRLLASLPLLRALLTFSALVWPSWGQGAGCRWLRQSLADLHLALLLGLSCQLLSHALGLPGGGLLAVVASRARAPKPTASGRIRKAAAARNAPDPPLQATFSISGSFHVLSKNGSSGP
jgi:hypothetical protein